MGDSSKPGSPPEISYTGAPLEGTLLGREEPPHLCLLYVLCINFFLIPRPRGLAPHPLPQPYSTGPDNKVLYFWSFGFLFSRN